MKKLVLAEKPSVGKEIARVLGCTQNRNGYIEGKDYIVTWALGHLVTLADPDHYDRKYANWHLEDLTILPERLHTVVIKKSGKQFSTVKHQILRDDVNEIIIATDAGREGELVARWIIQKVKSKKSIKRLWISSVTDKAIKQGFNSLKPGKSYLNLYHAAVARAEGDWYVGINATRALTTKYNTSLSCGRVQTPTLAMIKTKEDQIRQFRPKKYYGITCQTNSIKLQWAEGQSFNESYVDEIISRIKGENLVVKSISSKHKKKYASRLYDLTELQRDAYQRYKFSPKKTLSIMQRLYEYHKALTYPRTDSRYLTDDIVETLGERLKYISIMPYREHAFKLQKQDIKAEKHFVDNSKVSDHHAIIPTDEAVIVQDFSFEERQIYELVVKRFIEVLLPPYEYEESTLVCQVNDVEFKAKGTRTIHEGFKALSESSSKSLPLLNKGDKISVNQYLKDVGETKAPSYFNEATLLTAMENPIPFVASDDKELKQVLGQSGGLGTVATRADIIEKLYNTEVIETKSNGIHITNKGRQLLEVAPNALKSPLLTAEWELKLNKIAKGELDHRVFIQEMKTYTEEILSGIKGSILEFKHDNITSTKCPECGKLMMKKKGKHGESLVCQDRNCNHRISLSRVTNARCPECHKKLTLRGSGDTKVFVCKCGYKEKLSSFEKRKKTSSKAGNKKDYMNYVKKQKKAEDENRQKNNPFASLSGLKLDK